MPEPCQAAQEEHSHPVAAAVSEAEQQCHVAKGLCPVRLDHLSASVMATSEGCKQESAWPHQRQVINHNCLPWSWTTSQTQSGTDGILFFRDKYVTFCLISWTMKERAVGTSKSR